MKLIPIWGQVAIVVAVTAMIFGAGFKTASWRASGRIEKATARAEAAERQAASDAAFAKSCAEKMAEVREALSSMTTARDDLDLAYAEAIARPPEVVVRYRDRWHDAHDVIVSEGCPDAVGELITYLHSLPAFGGEG